MLKEKESSGRRLMRLSIKHPEEFRKQLGIVKRKNIPITLLNKIIDAEPGDVIKNPTKTGKKHIKEEQENLCYFMIWENYRIFLINMRIGRLGKRRKFLSSLDLMIRRFFVIMLF